MLMTAAGTVKAARVLILGAGVAGLQAIATAKRLGAVIEASDVRPAVKEQIESLGAKFLDVPYETDEEREAAQGVGGYAGPCRLVDRTPGGAGPRARQTGRYRDHDRADPGPYRPHADHRRDGTGDETRLGDHRSGRRQRGKRGPARRQLPANRSGRGGGQNGVQIAGYTNLAAMVAADASSLYARNVLDFLKLIINNEGELKIDLADDIVAATLLAVTANSRERHKETAMEVITHTITNLIIFVLAIYVGYHVVWNVTPALHTPLMAVTNAISAIVIVGAMLAAGLTVGGTGKSFGALAVALAAVNVFGGFLVTRRMLEMFRKKEPKKLPATSQGDAQ